MAINTLTENGLNRQLALRESADGSVELLWNSATEEISLVVKLGGDDFTVSEIPPENALDAFAHPYAYAERILKTGNHRAAA